MKRLSDQMESAAEITSTIKYFICSELLQRSDLHLSEDTALINDGYLTSLQAVELVMFLEEQFQIEIPPEEVNEEEFHSLSTLTALVQRRAKESL